MRHRRAWLLTAVVFTLRCGGVTTETGPKCEQGGALGIEARLRRGGGAELSSLPRGGPAEAAGLREGDLLVRIGEARVEFACEVDALAFNRACSPVQVEVQRDGASLVKALTPVDQGTFYRQACGEGDSAACYRMAWLTEDGDTARALLDEACDQGSGDACASRGYTLMEEKSPEAVKILQRGCDRGSGTACAHLAYAYAEALLMPRDEIRSLELYTRACSLGNELGCYSMGVLHDTGRGTSANQTRAASAYEEACHAGVSMACTDLGFLYERGRGVIADLGRAAELFRRGCDGSPCGPRNLRGCVNLGDAYRDGIGVAKDEGRAAEIFRTTCAAEVPADGNGAEARTRACVLFAALQFRGNGVPRDAEAAFRASKEGCDAGDAFGCFNVGAIYASRENYILASAFYDRACEGGDAEGCYELGMLHQDAQGVPFDPDRAATLLRRACEGGFRKACG